MKGNPAVLSDSSEDKWLVLHLWKVAIEQEDWKDEAVAAAMNEASARWERPLNVDGPYLSKMFSGVKPFTSRHEEAMPRVIRVRYARLYAEALGHVVVTPMHGPEAIVALFSGLVGLLMPATALPAKAGPQLKAALQTAVAVKRSA